MSSNSKNISAELRKKLMKADENLVSALKKSAQPGDFHVEGKDIKYLVGKYNNKVAMSDALYQLIKQSGVATINGKDIKAAK
jgi:beta-galactosidase beta subunit